MNFSQNVTWVWSDHPKKTIAWKVRQEFACFKRRYYPKSSPNGLVISHACILNAYLSYSATILNVVAIYAIRKTLSLSKNLKTLLLSLAVSDLGVGLLAQPMFVAHVMESKQNNETNESYNVIHIACLIPTNFFTAASLFSVMALWADRFLAIHLHLRYQEIETGKRIGAVVVSIWVISALTSLIRLFLSTEIMHVSFVIIESACIITATTSLSTKLYLTIRRHINQIPFPQVAQNDQGESVQRKRKSAMLSFYVYPVFIGCYLPDICVLIIGAPISEPTIDLQHLQFYTVTLLFLNSTLNPLIYCWKMKRIQHTIVGTLRHIFSSPT